MQTIDIHLNVPSTGTYSLEEFVAKVKKYALDLAQKQHVPNSITFAPNKETIAAIEEAKEHLTAYSKCEDWAKKETYDNVNSLISDLMKE